ncbi:hypothetical protein CAPTEDRAFT_154598 [Capitella teleta]|uniref:C2H2-type domain-containing protein n=1 Tax=Capitella teleta TaxID=283909 RepID=R7VEJ6_CAPTE|nr:hypothetical protein CAPTEDRAFT_154598 [Capitella teleta]|eukprot:ELU14100.1 hypothetical protein CAPTEDRAFT_154598 [Capitella teleta]
MDNQTAIAVQSLLESQTIVDAPSGSAQAEEEEEDVFQCGKCKKQFNSLSTFVSHKQTRCMVGKSSAAAATATVAVVTQNTATLPTLSLVTSDPQTMKQVLPNFSSIPHSPLTQTFGQNMVLSDELSIALSAVSFLIIKLPPFSFYVAERRLETIQVVSEPPAVTSQPGNTINLGNQGGNLVAIIHERVGNTAAAPPTLATNQNALPQPPTIKKLRCHYCDKAFVKNFDLQQHVRSHTGEKPFQCIVCGRAFAQKSNVKKHMATHKVWPAGLSKSLPDQPPPEVPSESTEKDTAETPDDAVPPVPQKFESEGDKMATGGVAPLITVDNTFICQYCGVKFKTYFLLKSHMVKHKSEQVYKCILRECSLTFKELDSFLEHTKTHEHEMSYRCHMCNKVFPSLYDLGVHQYSHSLYPNQGPKASPRHFRCMKCGVKYASPEALVHHLETETHHYECPHCQKVFTCERYLRRHLPIHVSVGIYECEVCYKRFKTENYLKVHSVTHTDEKPFACELCEAAFNRRDKLNRHMSTHDVNKKYKCPFKAHTGCNKEFNRADKLKAHIITHSGLRPFKCDMCPKYFTRRSNLTEHRRIHQDRYRYVCNSCGRKFQRSQFLLRHQCRVKEKKADEENNTDKESTATPATEQGDEQVKGQGEEEAMNTEDVDDPTKTPYLRNRRKIIKPKKRLITS